jgi:hypothetical protein
MLAQTLVPISDPSPLPAPYWVFKLLLNLTFLLHILAMNLLLGSGLLALMAKWKSNGTEYSNRLFQELSRILPSFLPATISIGVAPLLFVQVLYGQFFYSSSIIIAWPWFLVLGFLTAAYYGLYYASFRKNDNANRSAWAVSMSMVLVLAIGFIYTNNMTLSQTPDSWRTKYFADLTGWNLNLAEPTLIPRFLHFIIAAVAVGGLLIAIRGLLKTRTDKSYALYQIRFGAKAFMYATMAQFVIGSWLFMTLPHPQRMLFMGKDLLATAIFVLALIGAIGTLILCSGTVRQENPKAKLYGVTALTIPIIALMVLSRDTLRDSYLGRYLNPMPSQTQWEVFPLFLLIFIAGLGLWLLMLKRYRFDQQKPAEAAEMTHAGKR